MDNCQSSCDDEHQRCSKCGYRIKLIPGPRGLRGETGPRGERGDIGPYGHHGETGCKGDQGEHGHTGEKGDRGDAGTTGARGEPGRRGEKGDRGDIGPTGSQGVPGNKGEAGCKGEAGAKGDRGDIGPAGVKGDTGARGEAGAKGDRGDIGPAGQQGVTGSKGDRGDVGGKGDRGDHGARGDIGPAGPKGDRGDKGEKGDRGDVGPAGAKGDQGCKGDKGDQGPPGTCCCKCPEPAPPAPSGPTVEETCNAEYELTNLQTPAVESTDLISKECENTLMEVASIEAGAGELTNFIMCQWNSITGVHLVPRPGSANNGVAELAFDNLAQQLSLRLLPGKEGVYRTSIETHVAVEMIGPGSNSDVYFVVDIGICQASHTGLPPVAFTENLVNAYVDEEGNTTKFSNMVQHSSSRHMALYEGRNLELKFRIKHIETLPADVTEVKIHLNRLNFTMFRMGDIPEGYVEGS